MILQCLANDENVVFHHVLELFRIKTQLVNTGLAYFTRQRIKILNYFLKSRITSLETGKFHVLQKLIHIHDAFVVFEQVKQYATL